MLITTCFCFYEDFCHLDLSFHENETHIIHLSEQNTHYFFSISGIVNITYRIYDTGYCSIQGEGRCQTDLKLEPNPDWSDTILLHEENIDSNRFTIESLCDNQILNLICNQNMELLRILFFTSTNVTNISLSSAKERMLNYNLIQCDTKSEDSPNEYCFNQIEFIFIIASGVGGIISIICTVITCYLKFCWLMIKLLCK